MRYDNLTADTVPLWNDYFLTRGIEERNKLFLAIKDYFDSVMANWVYKRPSLFGRMEDVLATGYIYLLDTIARVDPAMNPVARQKYLITSILWRLHVYFKSTDQGIKRGHDKILERRGESIVRLDESIDIEDSRYSNEEIEAISLDDLNRAINNGCESYRLSPMEAKYIRSVVTGEKLLNCFAGYWKRRAFLRFKALALETCNRPFPLYKFLRVPATRCKWGVDKNGEECRKQAVLVNGYTSLSLDNIYPAVRFDVGQFTFICHKPDYECIEWDKNSMSARTYIEKHKNYPFSKFIGWLTKYAEHACLVDCWFNNAHKRFTRCDKSCAVQLKEEEILK